MTHYGQLSGTLLTLMCLQASLPVKDGGHGIRRAASLALPAVLASAASTSSLQDSILALSPCPLDSFFDTYLQAWSSSFGCSIPTDSLSSKQSFWERPGVLQDRAIVEAGLGNSQDRARFLEAALPHSAGWLHALPIAAGGLWLDDETVHIAVGLRGTQTDIRYWQPTGSLPNTLTSLNLTFFNLSPWRLWVQ